MKVVVPYATKSPMLPAVKLALRQDGWEAEYVHCSEDISYYNLLYRLWKQGQDFCIIEHDIVVFPGALTEMENCGHFWCTRPYYCSVGWIKDGLGCTKFSSAMILSHPSFLDEPFPSCCQHSNYFCGLDRLIAHRAQELHIPSHVHEPGVSNLNERWT